MMRTMDEHKPAALSAEEVPLSLGRWGLRLLATPLCGVSGAAALVEGLAWTQMLRAGFGSGPLALAAILGALLTGLALGGWILGSLGERAGRPLRLYGVLALGAALSGALLSAVLPHVGLADRWVYLSLGAGSGLLAVYRFVLILAVTLIPTALLGASLPLLARFVVRDDHHVGLQMGGLCAALALGAAGGSALAGLGLIGGLGLLKTGLVGAGMIGGAGLVALAISLGLERQARPLDGLAPASATAQTSESVYGVILSAPLLGAVASAAGIFWWRSLILVFGPLGSSPDSLTILFAVLLIGLGLGSALLGPLIDARRAPQRLYGILLTLVGMALLGSVAILGHGIERLTIAEPLDPRTGALNWPLALGNAWLQGFGVLGLPTLLLGMTLPAGARVALRARRIGRETGRLWGLALAGAGGGAALTGALLVPAWGMHGGLLILGAVVMFFGLMLVWRAPGGPLARLVFTFGALALVAGVYSALPSGRGARPAGAGERRIFYAEGAAATVAVFEGPGTAAERTLTLDGVAVDGTGLEYETARKALAHLPMMLAIRPRTALTIGFGSGGGVASLLLHDRLLQVCCAEVDPALLDVAPAFQALNHQFLNKPDARFRLLPDDAGAALRRMPQTYDVIAVNGLDLRHGTAADRLTVEWLGACRARLTEGGVLAFWLPLDGLSRDAFKMALRTFHHVFPEMAVFALANEPGGQLLLAGWAGPAKLDYARFTLTLGEADVREDLGELYLDDPVKLLAGCLIDGRALSAYVGAGPVNTADLPALRYGALRGGDGAAAVDENLADLVAARVSPRGMLAGAPLSAAILERLTRYEKALPMILEGHARARQNELEAAAECYLRARQLTPEDLSVSRNLLTFPALQRRLQHKPDDWRAAKTLGRILMIEGQGEQALDLLTRAEQSLAADAGRLEHAMQSTAEVERERAQTRKWIAALRQAQSALAP